jgi:predicted nucleic acid-binding protein
MRSVRRSPWGAATAVSIALHATCFDASALAKVYLEEEGSAAVRQYWRSQATRFTTPFCFYETLGILKREKLKGRITKQRYLRVALELTSWFRTSHSTKDDIKFYEIDVFNDVKGLAEHYDLDLSDAFQLLTLEAGYFQHLVDGSRTLLVTADEALGQAARSRGLPVWDCLREPVPGA